MKRKLSVLCLLLTLGCLARAEDKKSDPTGTWKWTHINPNGKNSETSFTFKLQGETLTGAVITSAGTTAITNGVFKGDQASFQTIREAKRNGVKTGKISTATYSGKLSGDTIKGRVEIDAAGKKLTDTWEAKRVKK